MKDLSEDDKKHIEDIMSKPSEDDKQDE
jgi:hypothetical protein